MHQAIKITRLFILFLIVELFSGNTVYAQIFLVENIDTKSFPELHFQLRSSGDLVKDKALLQIKDNNMPVKIYKVSKAPGGGGEENAFLYDVRYKVPDPTRTDGNTTFEYRGQQVTTAYVVKAAAPAATPAPAPKPAATPTPKASKTEAEESGTPWIYYLLGAGALIGIIAFFATRKKIKTETNSYPETVPSVPEIPEPVVPGSPVPAPVPVESVPASHTAYIPQSPMVETAVAGVKRAVLSVTQNGQNKDFPLTGNVQTIGRASTNDIVIDHPTVSGKHARIWLENGTWMLQDQNSTNGTYVNGNRISKILLQQGSNLYFGQAPGIFKLP